MKSIYLVEWRTKGQLKWHEYKCIYFTSLKAALREKASARKYYKGVDLPQTCEFRVVTYIRYEDLIQHIKFVAEEDLKELKPETPTLSRIL